MGLIAGDGTADASAAGLSLASEPFGPADRRCHRRYRASLLLVDDQELVLRALRRRLRSECEVLVATSADSALEVLGNHRVDTLVTDRDMPGGHDGVWLLEQVRQRYPKVRRVMMSGVETETQPMIESGLIERFLGKPIDISAIVQCLPHALERKA